MHRDDDEREEGSTKREYEPILKVIVADLDEHEVRVRRR
jgi:hypothetical protein